jgi:L-threonylcarbamoyladenylate synthase
VPDEITAGLDAVAVRAPAHPVARRLLAEVGAPVAAPSANRYTAISPTTAAHVRKSLGGRIDAILDGGATPVGIESTVLDLTGAVPVLLRPGAISREEIESVVGPIELRSADLAGTGARPSPGMVQKHYAPNARVTLFEPGHLPVLAPGARAGVIAQHPRAADADVAAWLQLPDDPGGFARQLYGALHALEDAGVTDVLLEEPPADPAWAGVRDRLHRAAG